MADKTASELKAEYLETIPDKALREQKAQLLDALTEKLHQAIEAEKKRADEAKENIERKLLNKAAADYLSENDSAQKRELLDQYLYVLMLCAAGNFFVYSIMKPVLRDGEAEAMFPKWKRVHFDFRPLEELMENLRKLNNREQPALLTKTTGKGRPPAKRLRQGVNIRASAVVTTLMDKSGFFQMSEDDAVNTVYRRIKKLGLPISTKALSDNDAKLALKSWRDSLMSGDKGAAAHEEYFWLLKIVKNANNQDGLLTILDALSKGQQPLK